MSSKERLRLRVLGQLSGGALSLKEAALALGLSYRQMRRVRRRYQSKGDIGLVHQLRGKASNRRTAAVKREAALALCREKYAGFGPTLASEYLAAADLKFSHDTVRRWLLSEGLMAHGRRRQKHRSRRERRGRAGEMVQMDGSWHDWLEGRGSWCCLMVMIDDATGRIFARFYEKETLAAAFDLFGRYAVGHGLPGWLYVDRSGIYRSDKAPTLEQELAGEVPLTQFGRAMKTLEVGLILANSPQAKGRVERMNGTLQDRLVKALRVAQISNMVCANQMLESFLPAFNAQFSIPARDDGDGHRVVTRELKEVLCEQHERRVGQDWCVQWRGSLLQIEKQHEGLCLAGKQVGLRQLQEGPVQLVWQGQKLSWRLVSARPPKSKAKRLIANNKDWKPAATHPWKVGFPAARASSPTAPQPLRPEQDQRTVLLR